MATRASLWLMMVVDVQLVFVQNVYLTKLSYLLSNRSIRTEQRLFQLRLPHFLYRTKNKAMRDDQKTLIIYNE